MIGVERVAVLRGGRRESLHEVEFAVHAAQELAGEPEPGMLVFLRSAAKPFQAAAVVRCGAADRFAMRDDELAILAASHSGEDVHTALVAGLLDRLGLDPSALGCGVHPPFDAATASRLGSAISALHHNCSGKHAGMLAAARRLGAPIDSYLEADSAVQQLMRRTVAEACGLAPDDVVVALDGCSAPTFAVPLAAAARAFSALARPTTAAADLREPLARVAEARRRHPPLVAGSGRFDTRLMQATRGRLVAKGGAEGVQGVADLESGVGLCLKVRDGASRAVPPATIEALLVAGCLDGEALRALERDRRPTLENFAGRTVGRIEATVEPAAGATRIA